MSDIANSIAEIERRLKAARFSVARLCREAEIDPTTWQRWKNSDTKPRGREWWRAMGACSKLIGWQPEHPANEATQ